MRSTQRLLPAIVALALLDARCARSAPRLTHEIPWHDRGVWLKADTHAHTTFSDGSETIAEVAAKAAEFGCDVVAITDHADAKLTGASPQYFAEIEAARRAHPGLVILAGLEWNLPPWDGVEHATVLAPPLAERGLARFKAEFDDYHVQTRDAKRAEAGLRWLADNLAAAGVKPVVFYEHPSRKRERSLDVVEAVEAWRRVNDLVVGFAGAPGHQGSAPIGAYERTLRPIDRWDPAAAQVGDAWDVLLGKGLDVWAASAPSDFHYPADFWPCQFSATWLYAPERSAAGALQALRAGSFFGVHGGIAAAVRLTASTPGLSRGAGAGETLSMPAGREVTLELRAEVPPAAWPEGPNAIDRAELIVIAGGSASVVASGPLAPNVPLTHVLPLLPGGMVVRARGRRTLPDGDGLAFYTNPVRVIARD